MQVTFWNVVLEMSEEVMTDDDLNTLFRVGKNSSGVIWQVLGATL